MIDLSILSRLNAPTAEERLAALRDLLPRTRFPAADSRYVNNHIHTIYSFSPYSPTAAVFAAKSEGLCTAGIVDHDSIAGAWEFLAAAEMADLPVTVGMECRVSMAGTVLADRLTNNPDQAGVSYMTLQSVPHDRIEALNDWFAPYRAARDRRNEAMVANINALLPEAALDYGRDVLPLSRHDEGGGVTERHLMYALALRLTALYGKGEPLIQKLEALDVPLSAKQRAQLLDTAYPFYEYDLLGIFKSAFLQKVYVKADAECVPLAEAVRLSREMDAVLCYAYLGDVEESVTGDKKAQRFEDAYLDDVFRCLKEYGVPAVTYMPTRNTPAQLARLRALCGSYGMFQVSGEDINSPRQGFIIHAMEDPQFQNLIDATWRFIEHERTGAPVLSN